VPVLLIDYLKKEIVRITGSLGESEILKGSLKIPQTKNIYEF